MVSSFHFCDRVSENSLPLSFSLTTLPNIIECEAVDSQVAAICSEKVDSIYPRGLYEIARARMDIAAGLYWRIRARAMSMRLLRPWITHAASYFALLTLACLRATLRPDNRITPLW